MRAELKWFIYIIGLGMSLVAYAHFTFATKSMIDLIYDKLKTIDQRVYDMHNSIIGSRK